MPRCRRAAPLLSRGGVAATSKENGAATSDGADGVVLVKRYVRFPDQHHPVCATKDASQLLTSRSHPSSAEEGSRAYTEFR